jgi:predicted neuraminidase
MKRLPTALSAALVSIACAAAAPAPAIAQQPAFSSEDVIPYQDMHVHGSSITELPNGDLMVAWFQGHGERQSDDVRIMGARKKKGSDRWSPAFVMADVKGFPDINPVLYVDSGKRLWLVWYTVLANQWESSLLKTRVSDDYMGTDGAPKWAWQEDLHVKFASTEQGIAADDPFARSVERQIEEQRKVLGVPAGDSRFEQWKKETMDRAMGKEMVAAGRVPSGDGKYEPAELGYPMFRRIGWQTRNKPVTTRTGRLILPLYSDGFSFSVMAYTDDGGETWGFSAPLVGQGNIQPTIAQTKSGELVAYMRDNGPAPKRLHISRSTDDGLTWSTVKDTDLPNPGSAADLVTLKNGHWALIWNDTDRGRNRLTVALSEDEGRSWPWRRVVELDQGASPKQAHYPAIIQSSDGMLHTSYSYFVPGSQERKTIRHAAFNEAWIRAGSAATPPPPAPPPASPTRP